MASSCQHHKILPHLQAQIWPVMGTVYGYDSVIGSANTNYVIEYRPILVFIQDDLHAHPISMMANNNKHKTLVIFMKYLCKDWVVILVVIWCEWSITNPNEIESIIGSVCAIFFKQLGSHLLADIRSTGISIRAWIINYIRVNIGMWLSIHSLISTKV